MDATQGIGKTHVDNAEKFVRGYETAAPKKEEKGGVGGGDWWCFEGCWKDLRQVIS